MKYTTLLWIAVISTLPFPLVGNAAQSISNGSVSALYMSHCARCHGTKRQGSVGPPLLPDSLERLSHKNAAKTIAMGRVGTEMPAFEHTISTEEINDLVKFIYRTPTQAPHWGKKRILSSYTQYYAQGSLPPSPLYQADPLNLFVVVENGHTCHRVTILNGDNFSPIAHFRSHIALHGGPKFSRHGRYVYFASRNGWITKYDLFNLKIVDDVRAGITTRNIALSSDGRYVLVGNYLPHNLVILDAKTLLPIKIVPAVDINGHSSRISAVYDARPRGSFIAALKDSRELWEISYRHHDLSKKVKIRRLELSDYPDDFFIDPSYHYMISTTLNSNRAQVVDLDTGRVISHISMPGMPHLGSAITWSYHDHQVFATPNIKTGVVTVVDMHTWKVIRHIHTLGPGYFIRSHQNTPYAWVDIVFGPHRDAIQIIDKRTLKVVRTLYPMPGHISMHIEFDRYGRHALISIWEEKGAVVVYDATTFKIVKRIPMCKPVGKYNVFNKINLSPGTSH